MKTKIFSFGLICLLLTASGIAQGQKRKRSSRCAHPKTQGEMNQCANNDWIAADAVLNQVYQKLLTYLDEGEKAHLKDAENAWIKYRDSHCTFVADQYTGGTAEPAVYDSCLADVTRHRTTELRAQTKYRKL